MTGDLAGLADQLEVGQPVEQGCIDARAFAGEDQGVGIGEAGGQLVQRGGWLVVKHANVVPSEAFEAFERANDVLVVIGNGNAHGGRPWRSVWEGVGPAWHPWPYT